MTIPRLRALPAVLILLSTILACALPGQAASPPAPTADTVLLVTMVAETFSAAVEQTANAALPTSTPTPPPSSETSIPELPTSPGSTLTKQADGGTLFDDQLAGFSVTVPAGWLALRVNEQEYLDAWTLAEASDPAIQSSLTVIQNQNPNQLRLFALDTQDGHVQGGFVTNINFLWDQQNEMSFEDGTDLNAAADSLPNAIPGIEILTYEISANAGGIPMGIITSKWPAKTADGADVVIHQKQVFLSVKTGTMVITLSTTEGLKDTVLPAFDAMIETIATQN